MRRTGEWRVVAFVALVVLTAEAGMRLFEAYVSRNFTNIRNLPAVADAMKKHDGEKIAVVGNSLTGRAVDGELLTAGLKGGGMRNPAAFFLTPDGSSVIEWDYALRRYFTNRDAVPDIVLLGTGEFHLRDESGRASRLGALFVDDQDMGRAWREDLPDWEQKCEFLIARFSVLHAARSRVKPHVFGRLIPHYFDMEQWINHQRYVVAMRNGAAAGGTESYSHLTALLRLLKEKAVKTTIFSIPLPKDYHVSDAALKVIENEGGNWLDLSSRDGFPAERFPDGYHLDQEGTRSFTRRLVEALNHQ